MEQKNQKVLLFIVPFIKPLGPIGSPGFNGLIGKGRTGKLWFDGVDSILRDLKNKMNCFGENKDGL